MAVLQTVIGDKEMWPYFIREIELSGIVSDVAMDITHGGPTGFKADQMTMEWVAEPTIPCAATVYHTKSSDTTTTARVKVVSENGGDLAGAKLRLRFYFPDKSGGISSSTET